MNSSFARNIIQVIRHEQERRKSLLAGEEPDFAYDQWLFGDLPFIAELCLMLLVALRHQVEKELVHLAARAADGGKEIEPQHYRKRLEELTLGRAWKWETIYARLNLKSCEGERQVKALRLLANCYKHDLSKGPDEELLNLLNLETGVPYAPLPESSALEGLAVFVGLENDADYCAITERFTEIVDRFLATVQTKAKLSRIKWGAVSLLPENFAR